MDKWFITGGSGFLGSNIIEILKKKNIDFVNFDLLPPEKYKENYLKGDIRDVDSLKIALKGCNKIIHAAASLPLNKKLFTEINVKGTENLVELANYHNIEHFTYISSSSIFGTKNEEIMNEETIPSPVEQYGKSKYLGELVVTENPKEADSIIVNTCGFLDSATPPGFSSRKSNGLTLVIVIET